MKKILITGGAGFVGSHIGRDLLEHGYTVRALDNLSPQVHGPEKKRPSYLDPRIELMVGDVRNRPDVVQALDGMDAVVHLAAAVGVGQSMYEIAEYVSTNNLGTAVLLEALSKKPVERLLVASSMSVYGEGLYQSSQGEVAGVERPLEQLKRHEWELVRGSEILKPIPTPETKQPTLASIYALSKYDQERMCLMIGSAYGIPATALRLFNIYGPHQALSNPYTGVLAIFASRLLNKKAPVVYEDGNQRRDFVSVYDVAHAFWLALEKKEATGAVLNIGSGVSISVTEVAQKLARTLGSDIEPEVSGKYRLGDIRHCFADITNARSLLGYEPHTTFEEGLKDLVAWLSTAQAEDYVEQANAELAKRGLVL